MIIRGNELILFHGATNTVFSRATSCNLELSNESIEVTSKSSGLFKEFLKGRMEWSISVDGLVDFEDVNGFKVLNAAMFSGEDIDVAIGIAIAGADTKPTGMDNTKVHYVGKVKIESLNLNTANAGELTTYSATLKGNGQLEFVEPTGV